MSSIPLPALSIRPPQQQDNPLQQYGQLMQLKNEMANQPLQRQALQQQVQSGGLQLEQQQQAQKDQQAFRQVFSDPSMKGKTISDIADHLAQKGQISQQSYQAAKKADIEQRQSLATLDKDQLANADAAHKATQQIYDSVMDMPDEQLAQNWPQIAQQYDSIPGNNKAPLDPSKPLTKEQLQQFGPMIAMQRTYLDEAAARHKKEADLHKVEVDTTAKESENAFYAQNGGAPGVPVEAQQQADWLKKHPGKGPSDFAVAQAGNKAGAEASARQPYEMALARQRQALTQGDPRAAAQLLVSGDATLSELKARGATPDFIANTLNAARELSGGKYNAQQAEANFSVAKSPANTAFFGSAKSLTDPGGTLDQLAAAGKKIPGNQIPAFNSISDWQKAATGSGPLAHYAATALGVADDYAKVMGGGAGSDTSRLQALNLIKSNASPEARTGALQGIRGAVQSQTNSRIGNNPIMKRMYGSAEESTGNNGPAVGSTKKFPNGKTGVWDGHGYVAQ